MAWMTVVSLLLLLVVLALLAYHRFASRETHPDSDLATMVLLALLLPSGVCFAAVERNASWANVAVSLQVVTGIAAVSLHLRLAAAASWVDEKGARVEGWWESRRK